MRLALLSLLTLCVRAEAPRLFPVFSEDGKKVGFINNKGAEIVSPRFERAEPFFEGIAAIWIDRKAGYINAVGKVIVEPAYEYANEFHESVGIVHQGDTYTLFDTNGRKILETSDRVFREFHGGLCRISRPHVDDKGRKQTLWGFIDKQGKVVIQPQFINTGFFPDDGLGLTTAFLPGSDRAVHYIDRRGATVFKVEDAVANENTWFGFHSGLTRAKKDGWWGYRDEKGNWAIAAKYDEATDFQDGRAAVVLDRKQFTIDKQGNTVSPLSRFRIQEPFAEGFAVVYANARLTYINDRDETPFRLPILQEAHSFSNGLARVKIDGKFGFIDKIGAFAVKPVLDGASDFRYGLASVSYDDGTFAYINTAGERIYQRVRKR